MLCVIDYNDLFCAKVIYLSHHTIKTNIRCWSVLWMWCAELNKRDGVDSSGTHSDRGDRIRSAVSAMEHCTAWVACRPLLHPSHCFHHSLLFFSSMQHLSPSPSRIRSQQKCLLPWCCSFAFRYLQFPFFSSFYIKCLQISITDPEYSLLSCVPTPFGTFNIFL